MKKILYILLPIFLYSQTIDSLIVNFTNPDGGGVQGVPQGFSKITIQTGIQGLSFDPFFTRANSADFKISKTSTGYDIIVNIKKIEKEEGVYSNLKFEIKHPKFLTYEIDEALMPGRSYNFIVNPKNPNQVDEKLIQYMTRIDFSINNASFADAKNEVGLAEADYPGHVDLQAYRIYIQTLDFTLDAYERIAAINDFNSKNPTYSIKDKLEAELNSSDGTVGGQIREFSRTNQVDSIIKYGTKYLDVAISTMSQYSRIKKVVDDAKADLDLAQNGLSKTTRFTFNVSPPGMDVFIDGVKQSPVRAFVNDSLETLTITYQFKVFSRTENYPIKWSIEDPNKQYSSLSYDDYDDTAQEWFVSHSTKLNKEISGLIKLERGSSFTWETEYYYYSGGALLLGVLLLSSDDSTGGGDKFIGEPTSPKWIQKKSFKLNFGVSF